MTVKGIACFLTAISVVVWSQLIPTDAATAVDDYGAAS